MEPVEQIEEPKAETMNPVLAAAIKALEPKRVLEIGMSQYKGLIEKCDYVQSVTHDRDLFSKQQALSNCNLCCGDISIKYVSFDAMVADTNEPDWMDRVNGALTNEMPLVVILGSVETVRSEHVQRFKGDIDVTVITQEELKLGRVKGYKRG